VAALATAVREWQRILGPAHVVEDPVRIARAEAATFATEQRISAILRPGTRSEVQDCLRTASAAGVPVYPVSRGRNWGFGSRVPPRDGCVLIELDRLDGILDLDERMAHVTVEPGVTFRQLHAFLGEKGSRLFLNTTGGSPDASVIGNALERGDGAGPYADRFAHVCALEVVLATGECLHTGFGRFGALPVTPLHRWGVGPALDGLFAQSNLGVVTRMTVWLSPRPRSLQAVRFSIRDPALLPEMVDALRVLRMDGTLRASVGLWNDYRMLSTRGPYPWAAAGGRTPLDRPTVDALATEWGGCRWFGLTGLYAASEEQGVAHRAHVHRVLGPRVDHLAFEALPDGENAAASPVDPALKFLQGIPHEASLRSVYWRKKDKGTEDIDPDRDRCGVLWLCTVVPFAGEHAAAAIVVAEEVMPAHGFEPLLAIVAPSERCLYVLPLLTYDRDVNGDDDRAKACHDALVARHQGLGYLPHRLGIQSMGALPAPVDDSAEVLRRIKRALDPAGILAPGRYDGAPLGEE
jgi:4-cresol dehydrogenase (hydroxylating)